jgi:hypothetical protein
MVLVTWLGRSFFWNVLRGKNRKTATRDWRFVGFVERMEADDDSDPDTHAAPLSEDDWDEECPSIEHLDPAEIQAKADEGWLCTHWPMMHFLNQHRAKSIDSRKKYGVKRVEEGGITKSKRRKTSWHHRIQQTHSISTTEGTAIAEAWLPWLPLTIGLFLI